VAGTPDGRMTDVRTLGARRLRWQAPVLARATDTDHR
jgi:hypothetical protein